jgi:hypothetical protein
MEVSGQPRALAALPPGKNPGTHCTKEFSCLEKIKSLSSAGIRTLDYPGRSYATAIILILIVNIKGRHHLRDLDLEEIRVSCIKMEP